MVCIGHPGDAEPDDPDMCPKCGGCIDQGKGTAECLNKECGWDYCAEPPDAPLCDWDYPEPNL